MDNYDLYLDDLRDRIDIDRETRLAVLDAAAGAEMELLATAVFYLMGPDRFCFRAG